MARAVILFFKKNHQKPFFYSSLFFAALFLITIIIKLVFSWNAPTTIPPNPAGQTLYSDSSNNIGIGTLYPGAKMEIYSTSSDSVLKLSRQSATSTLFKLGTDSALIINNNNSDVLTIKNGNVGIGTTAPAYKLEIVESSLGTKNQIFLAQNNGAGGIHGWKMGSSGTSGDFDITRYVSSVVTTKTLTILENGNVGIGTTIPNSKLEVAGTIHSTAGGFKFPDNTTQTTAGGGALFSEWTCRDVSCATKCSQIGKTCEATLYFGESNAVLNVGCGTTYVYDCAHPFLCLCK